MKYPKGTATQEIHINTDSQKGIECYVDTDFMGSWNKTKSINPGLDLSTTRYTVMHMKFWVLWVKKLRT